MNVLLARYCIVIYASEIFLFIIESTKPQDFESVIQLCGSDVICKPQQSVSLIQLFLLASECLF